MDYAHTMLYTHNYQAFQGITRKIGRCYPRENYACNTLAIVSAEILFTPRDQLLAYQGCAVVLVIAPCAPLSNPTIYPVGPIFGQRVRKSRRVAGMTESFRKEIKGWKSMQIIASP